MYARDQARKNKSPEYRTLRNEVVKMIKKDKRETATKALKNNPHHLWKIFNKIIHGKDSKSIKLIEEGETINDEKKIAKTMNEFFHSKVEKVHK